MIYRAKITNKISMKIANFVSGKYKSTAIPDCSVAQLVWTFMYDLQTALTDSALPDGHTSFAWQVYCFYAPVSNDRGILFSSCLFFCLSVCLSDVNFNLRYNFWTVREREFIFGNTHSTKDTLSDDNNVNDLVTSTLTLKLKNRLMDFVDARA